MIRETPISRWDIKVEAFKVKLSKYCISALKVVLSHKLFCHLLNYAFDFVIMGFGTHREGENGQMWRSHAKLPKILVRGLKIEEISA